MNNSHPQSCIIVDDDPTTIVVFENYIAHIPKLRLESSFTDPLKAIDHIKKLKQIEFLFLDIKMKVSGIDIAKKLRGHVRYLIFITAYKEYALDAFKVGCDQYLVKPVSFEKFLSTVNELIKKNRKQSNITDFTTESG
ncbi:LytR/AlgR family response regulator transcription factor [Pedobacter aquatilis]|uniref:LytR/AlgR family response regulator transcription factor n=1 Tax=Pedobacter aquatilis TaxID=351343 RepID=UPI00292FA15E|nr:response regulator [Pedobacter aquatilis]